MQMSLHLPLNGGTTHKESVMLELLALMLWYILCYIAGYMLGLALAEWITRTYPEGIFNGL